MNSLTDSVADTTTATPRTTSPPDVTPKRGTGRPRKPPATTKPKRHSAGADLWTNGKGDRYLRIEEDAFTEIEAVRREINALGFVDNIVTASLRKSVGREVAKLREQLRGELIRMVEGLKGGAGEGA